MTNNRRRIIQSLRKYGKITNFFASRQYRVFGGKKRYRQMIDRMLCFRICVARALVALIAVMFSGQLFARTVELKDMEMHTARHQWTFVFHLNKPAFYRGFWLSNPRRYVLDLKDVFTKQRLHYKELLGTPISKLRYATHKDHILRMVFDLDIPLSARVHEVAGKKPGSRELELRFVSSRHQLIGFDKNPKASYSTSTTSYFEDNSVLDFKKKS